MADHHAKVIWRRGDQAFSDNRYSRGHVWEFDGGARVPASSSPHVVPPPLSVEENVDPEEAFVASLSSCHMLFFLSIAARRGYVVDEYADDAIGTMGKDAEGRTAITSVRLRPRIEFADGGRPSAAELEQMHHSAHELCFIANSVKTAITTEPA